MKTEIFACQSKNNSIRDTSSSGGVFPLLAKSILNENGIVYGAAFADDHSVEHIRVDSKDNIYKLYGSKYVFSHIGKIFENVKQDLTSERKVLFVGTPCQISALKQFLSRDYENLITVDFICHGAPSKEIWLKYLSERSGGKQIKSINFRDKSNGWIHYRIIIEYEDGTVYSADHDKDPYMAGFLKNYILREACFRCNNKGIDTRKSDVTLGDLWHADELAPTLFDDRGTSVIMIHSQKGADLFDTISDEIVREDINADQALKYNWAALRHVDPNPLRNDFLKTYNKSNRLIDSLSRYAFPGIIKRLKKKIRSLAFRK